ncbi:MAG: hypothetical protein K5744_06805 [Eubacterium sp.]|nr:hypothetical protein [Eubacterium sp.]
MNILYRACASKNGYQSTILNQLYKKGVFERCTVITQALDNKDHYSTKIYHEIEAKYGYSCSYDKMSDFDGFPEVSEDVLEKMRRYESFTLNMTCRNHHMHIMYYDEMYKEYMRHVRFWNRIIDEDEIDMVFLCTVPHCAWEYVIYSLAKAKGIPVLIETVANIPGFNEVGTSLENLGQNVKVFFDKDDELRLVGWDKNVKEYVNKVLNHSKSLSDGEKQHLIKNQKKWVYSLYHKPIIKRAFNTSMMRFALASFMGKRKVYNNKLHYNFELVGRYFIKKFNYGDLKYYDTMITDEEIDYSLKYIFYALQYFPESSVLPRGGVYWNQLNAIKTIANVASKYGVLVYVKEHWIEEGRSKAFYQELKDIKGVVCVPSKKDSFDLIKKSIAVASETGTCIQESILLGKPVITFANSYMCGAPGVFRIKSEGQFDEVIRMILDNYVINEKQVMLYFKAMSKTLVKGYLDWPSNSHIDFKECMEDTINLISSFVDDGMKEDFIYIK